MNFFHSALLTVLTLFSCLGGVCAQNVPLNSHTLPEALQSVPYQLFPYRNYVVFTVQKIFQDRDKRFCIKGYLSHVLKGELKANHDVTLQLSQNHGNISVEKSMVGKTCIIAFNELEGWKNPLPLSAVSFEYVGVPLSSNDIRALKIRLANGCFPYRSCWLFTVLDDLKRDELHPSYSARVRIDEIFIADQRIEAGKLCPKWNGRLNGFSAGDVLPCLFPEYLKLPRKGTRVLWKFDPIKYGDSYELRDHKEVCPASNIGESDLQELRNRLRDQPKRIEKLNEQLQAAMLNFWTVERIKKFCNVSNLLVPYTPALKGGMHCDYVLCGSLHEDKPELGKITWYANIKRGEPDAFQLDVVCDDKHWRCQIFDFPDLLHTKNSDLVKRVVRYPF